MAVRLAVDAGPALAGLVAGQEGAELVALGEAPERVERLIAVAAPGEILVGAGVPADADPALEPAAAEAVAPLVGVRRLPT
jgi:class 3 adenylate cyclase